MRTLKALWEYREALRQRSGQADKVENAPGRLLTLINRIEGRSDNAPSDTQSPTPGFDRPRLNDARLRARRLTLSRGTSLPAG